ncbi:MAG TPA: hypothetical protein VHG29_10265 [Novosphingobium sp.]|nr:hypothetical protein [Novosphingobium sp.]
MATRPIGNDTAPVTLPGGMPPIPAVARILARFDRDQLHGFIAVAIDLADAMEPDPDLEPDGDDQDSDGDERGDQAWVEWTSMRRDAGRQHNECLGEEDDELAGDETDAEGCEDDHLPPRMQSAANRGASAAGCIISDPDFCLAGDDRIGSGSLTRASLLYEDTGPGDADDAEIWQMTDNVPCPVVATLDHNIFTDRRQCLGRANLMSSFRTNGQEVRSVDSGAALTSHAEHGRPLPGVPV